MSVLPPPCRIAVRRAVLLGALCALHLAASAAAQSVPGIGGFDLQPPLIEHEVLPIAEPGFRQGFSAEVTDDRALASVTLHWRFAGEIDYAIAAMDRVADADLWLAQVPTSPEESRAIEYFIEARDTGGNRTVRGFLFSPLVRRIRAPVAEVVPPAEPGVPGVERRRVVYYVLGALAVGLIAGFATAGNDGDSAPSECGDDGCEVVITFQSPVVQ